jgi:DNA-binding response OmpR family regulator
MTLADQVGLLEERLARSEAENVLLRQYLSLDDDGALSLILAHKLTRQEASLLAKLMAERPDFVDRWALEAAIPSPSAYGARRNRIVDVLVCTVRKKVGADIIENKRGQGWRISPDFRRAA